MAMIMLKTFLEERNITVYKLAKESHIPYSTLNDLVNCKLPIENLRCGQLRVLADTLGLDMDSLYNMYSYCPKVVSDRYGVCADITVKHKCFWLNFQIDGKHYTSEILPVGQEAFRYLEVLAVWKLDEILAQLEMEGAYESVFAETV